MIDFKTYYNSEFRKDINRFFFTIPEISKFHEDRDNKMVYAIQYERLSPERNHLNFLNSERKEFFGVALFFTVLTDMVCYTYYKDYYNKFQRLTNYPKLIGNCLTWCHIHLHPILIFNAMNHGRNSTERHLKFTYKFSQAIKIMEEEVIHFFIQYLPEINGTEFWDKCKDEFPYRQTKNKINKI